MPDIQVEEKPEADEPPIKLSMALVWEELTPEERNGLSLLLGINTGQMALSKVSTVLKGIWYKHYYSAQMIGGQSMSGTYSYPNYPHPPQYGPGIAGLTGTTTLTTSNTPPPSTVGGLGTSIPSGISTSALKSLTGWLGMK